MKGTQESRYGGFTGFNQGENQTGVKSVTERHTGETAETLSYSERMGKRGVGSKLF